MGGSSSPKNVPETRYVVHGTAWLEERGILVDSEKRQEERQTHRQIETAPEWTSSFLLPRQQP